MGKTILPFALCSLCRLHCKVKVNAFADSTFSFIKFFFPSSDFGLMCYFYCLIGRAMAVVNLQVIRIRAIPLYMLVTKFINYLTRKSKN